MITASSSRATSPPSPHACVRRTPPVQNCVRSVHPSIAGSSPAMTIAKCDRNLALSPAGPATVAGTLHESTAQPLSTVIPGLDPGIQESGYRKQLSCNKSSLPPADVSRGPCDQNCLRFLLPWIKGSSPVMTIHRGVHRVTLSPAGPHTVAGQVQEPTARPLSTVIPGLDSGIHEWDCCKQFSSNASPGPLSVAAELRLTRTACGFYTPGLQGQALQ